MDAADSSDGNSQQHLLADLRGQRDQALACLWLSLAISLAVLITNYYDRRSPALADLRTQIQGDRQVLSEVEQALNANGRALQENRAALEKMRETSERSKP